MQLHCIYTNNYFWLVHFWWLCQCSLQSVIKTKKNFKYNMFVWYWQLFGDLVIYCVTNVVFFGPVLKFYYIFVPEIHPSAGIRIIQGFFYQKYPNYTKIFWTTQIEDLIQIKTEIRFCDLILIQNTFFLLNNPFSRFDTIRWPQSDQITFEQLAPGCYHKIFYHGCVLGPLQQ